MRWTALLLLCLGCVGGSAAVDPPTGDVPSVERDAGAVTAPDVAAVDAPSAGLDAPSAGLDAPAAADDAPEDDDALFSWPDLPAPSPDAAPSDADEPAGLPTAMAQPDPCVDRRPTREGTDGDDVIHGTPGDDVIFGGDGDDVIDGGGGNDVLCGGNGEDHLIGGAGADYLDGGSANDLLEGGDGDDVVHGRAGSDLIRGGDGDDALFGDVLDDDLYGEGGSDVLVGGHGNDFLHGGEQGDWLRGDTGHDTFVGGGGADAASFATALPPGQALNDRSGPAPDGVTVDFTERLTRDDVAWDELAQRGFTPAEIVRAGVASGDGVREALLGVEVVIGSHFDDRLVAASGSQRLYGMYGDDALVGRAVVMEGGPGADTCDGARCDRAGEPPGRPGGAFAFVDGNARDTGVGVFGGVGDDALSVVVGERSVAVTAVGATITPGTGCRWPDPRNRATVTCALPHAPRYLTGYGDAGDDAVTIHGGVPRDLTSHVSGGAGDDTLLGGAGEDVLFSGPTGRDSLVGNAGDDALLSESPAMDHATRGEAYAGGADRLEGGPGNDQLVSDYPCGRHAFSGGPGIDIAGFRRSTGTRPPFYGITAQLGGPAATRQAFHGRAFNPARCALDPWATTLAGDLEILEGADGDDRLFGNDANNTIWAWGGADTVVGYGGNDVLSGNDGSDEIYGGEGRDTMLGGRGFDHVYARDGAADARIDCGADEGRLETSDADDPRADRCN
jgi:Ca2+-binding RTX toxin-like protein